MSTTPGLHFKAPFADTPLRFDKRVQHIDVLEDYMCDIDGIAITIKSDTRYRIVDPLQFFKTLKPEHTARSRLSDIATASLRIEVADDSSSEIIDGEPVLDSDGIPVIDEDGLPILKTSDSRTALLENAFKTTKAQVEEGQFGVEMIDVKIRAWPGHSILPP